MARVRTGALLGIGRFALCGVAARRRESALALAEAFGGAPAFAGYSALEETRPEAVLVEVPHNVQDEAVAWGLERGCHVLIGGPLASTPDRARRVREAADARGLVVEAGFEARYKPVWETARQWVEEGRLGTIVAGSAIALWPADPECWYYDQAASGGMPLTHMTYCFINPLRWLLGEPELVAARANRLVETTPGRVDEETCVALLQFPADLPVSLTASYVRAAAAGSWQVILFGSRATLEILPEESGPGRLRLLQGESCEEFRFPEHEDGFARQAQAFADTIAGGGACRNSPADCLGDIVAADAIRRAVRP